MYTTGIMRKRVAIIQQLMNLLGMNPLKADTFLGCHIRILLVCITQVYTVCVTILFMFHSEGDFLQNFLSSMTYTSYATLMIFCIFLIHLNKPSFGYVLSSMNSHVFNYPDEDEFSMQYGEYLSEASTTQVHLLVLLFEMSGFAIPLLSPFATYLLVGKLEFHMYPQWVPWSLESFLGKILPYSMQLAAVLVAFMEIHIIQLYFVYVMVEFLRQHKKLIYAIKTLTERSHRSAVQSMKTGGHLGERSQSYEEEYNNAFRYNITMCIRHHQAILKLFKEFKIFYNIEFSLILLNMSYSFTLILYGLIVETDPIHFLEMLGIAFILITNLFFRCYIGEQFSEMNLGIQNALFYDLNWYDQSPKNKKLIVIFHCGSTQTYTLRGFSVFPASYNVFSRMMKSSYSLFNFLQASI